MREEIQKRESYWVVEATSKDGRVIFHGTFTDFDSAWEKYYSYKGKASVLLQRRYREYKVSA